MKTIKRAAAIFFAFVVFISVFSGCTKDDSDKDTTSEATVSSSKEDSSDKDDAKPDDTTEKSSTESLKNVKTGDIITFGSYPQTKVIDTGLIAALNSQTLQDDSTVTYDGSRYMRVHFTKYTSYWNENTTNPEDTYQDDNGYYINTVYWFKFKPVQWRILSNTNDELFVMAEVILASRDYNQVLTDVTWETCTLRTWLNNDFYDVAFDLGEKAKIRSTRVVNADYPNWHTDGGNDTNDKVFLLSYDEAINPAYGFSPDLYKEDLARRAQGSDFAKSNGLCVEVEVSRCSGNSDWWLRSPGDKQDRARLVGYDGEVGNGQGPNIGVRPALWMNL